MYITLLDSYMKVTDKGWLCRSRRTVQSMRPAPSKAEKAILIAVQKTHLASNIHMNVLYKLGSQQLNRLVMCNGLQGMLERNAYTVWTFSFLLTLHCWKDT